MYRQAASIAYHGSLHFPTALWWGSPIDTSKYGIGLSLLYLPGLGLFSWLRGAIPLQHGASYDFGLLYGDPVYALAAAPIHALLTAATAYLIARLLRDLGFSRRIALFGLIAYGIASPAIIYARGDWAQPLLGFCWMAALVAAVRLRRSGGRGALIACAVAVGYGVLARPVEGSLIVPFLVLLLVPRWAAWRERETRARLAAIAAGYGTGVLITLLVDWGRYGSPFTTGYTGEGWTTLALPGLLGSLVSPVRGILWQFPAVVLSVVGLQRLWRTEHRRLALALGALAMVQLLNVALWDVWWGGANWGLRLFVPALPLLAVLAAAGLAALRPSLRPAIAALVLLGGALWALPAIVTDLFGGYTILADGSAGSFNLAALPVIGAWQFLHHLRALTITDPAAVDIIWFRLARMTHNLSFIVPSALLLAAIGLAARVAKLTQTYNGSHADLPG